MTLLGRTLTLVAVALLGLGVRGQRSRRRPCDARDRGERQRCRDRPGPRARTWSGCAPAARRVGKLLVFLPSGGANNLPPDFEELGTEGARLGYHTIVLAYQNEAPIAAAPPAGCGNSVGAAGLAARTARSTRAWRSSTGDGESTVVNVDRANSIENRLTKVLQYLAATYPDEGWSQFLDTSGVEPAPKWSEIVIAGAVARRRPGRPDRAAALGAPGGVVRRLDGRQARLGHARSDALEPVLRADPPARQLLRAHVLRVSRAGPRPELPAARLHDPAGDGRPGQPVAGREPPAAVRDAAARVQPRAGAQSAGRRSTRTTRARHGTAGSPRDTGQAAVAEAAERLALRPR